MNRNMKTILALTVLLAACTPPKTALEAKQCRLQVSAAKLLEGKTLCNDRGIPWLECAERPRILEEADKEIDECGSKH